MSPLFLFPVVDRPEICICPPQQQGNGNDISTVLTCKANAGNARQLLMTWKSGVTLSCPRVTAPTGTSNHATPSLRLSDNDFAGYSPRVTELLEEDINPTSHAVG